METYDEGRAYSVCPIAVVLGAIPGKGAPGKTAGKRTETKSGETSSSAIEEKKQVISFCKPSPVLCSLGCMCYDPGP